MSTLMSKLIEMVLVCQEKLAVLGRDESGASAIEYALIVGLIVGVLVTAIGIYTDEIKGIFQSVADQLKSATNENENGGG